MACNWSNELIISPKKVGEYLEFGITALDGSTPMQSVSVMGYNPATNITKVFGTTIPNSDGWAGMPMSIITPDMIGTWEIWWEGLPPYTTTICRYEHSGRLTINEKQVCTGSFGMDAPGLSNINPIDPKLIATVTAVPATPVNIYLDNNLVQIISITNKDKLEAQLDIVGLLKSNGIITFDKEHVIKAMPISTDCTYYPGADSITFPKLLIPCTGLLSWVIPSISNINPTNPSFLIPITFSTSNTLLEAKFGIYIDNNKVDTLNFSTTKTQNLDVINLVKKLGVPIGDNPFSKSHTIEIRSEIKNCDIQPTSLSFIFPAISSYIPPIPTIPPFPTIPPIPTTPQVPITPTVPIQETRIVSIVSEGQDLPGANEGQTVQISALISCKTGETITKPRGTAYLIIDGANEDNKQIEQGQVTFEWIATAVPVSQHVICINVPPSNECKSPGQDCKRIYVNPIRLSIGEQLSKERASAKEQRDLLSQQKRELRQQIIGSTIEVPGFNIIPSVVPDVLPKLTPIIPPTPTPPIEPVTPPEPSTGTIELDSLPGNLRLDPNAPIYLYIDGFKDSRIYDLPKIVHGLSVGRHDFTIKLGNLEVITVKAYIGAGATTILQY